MTIKVLYLILSGGKARRIGGKCKLLLNIGNMLNDNMLVLDYVLKLIPAQAAVDDAIILNCNDENDGLVLTKILNDRLDKAIPCITDMPEFMGQGPLAGMLAGLDVAREHNIVRHQFDAIITLPSDTPFMPKDIATKLQDASANGKKIVSAFSNKRAHPVVSLIPIVYRDALYDYLASGNRKIQPFFEADDWRLVKFDETRVDAAGYDPFININTEQDLRIAHNIAAKLQS